MATRMIEVPNKVFARINGHTVRHVHKNNDRDSRTLSFWFTLVRCAQNEGHGAFDLRLLAKQLAPMTAYTSQALYAMADGTAEQKREIIKMAFDNGLMKLFIAAAQMAEA